MDNNIRRISFLGGPGAGKSTAAAYVFSQMKLAGYHIELINEYAKRWANERRVVKKYDQLLFLGKQSQYEYQALKGGFDYLITDSPLLLNYVYSKLAFKESQPVTEAVKAIIREFERDFPALYIFLRRDNKVYDHLGRFQSYEEACAIDDLTRQRFHEVFGNEKELIEVNYQDYDTIIKTIYSHINKQ